MRINSIKTFAAVALLGAGLVLLATTGPNPAGQAMAQATKAAAGPATVPASRPATTQAGNRAEIDALIDKAGKEPPDWWDSVKLTYPDTLDLTWATGGGGGGGGGGGANSIPRYFRANLDHNPARHKEGAKLLHQIIAVNKDNKPAQARAMQKLGQYYGQLLRDYARGAFWYRKAAKSITLNTTDTAILANCYFKLGSPEMALEELTKPGQTGAVAIRMLGQIGEVTKALDLAKQVSATRAEEAWYAAGDVCRFAGRYAEAIKYYEQAAAPGAGRRSRYQARATASIAAINAMQQIDLTKIPDGTYRGESNGYRGPVRVEITVKAGRIEDAKVTTTREDWPQNAQVALPAQIIEKQSVKGIANICGATVTSEAVINAAGKALGSGVK